MRQDSPKEDKVNKRLLLLKIIHTVVWAAFVLMLVYILFSGIADRIDWFTYVCMAAVIFEGIVLLIFRWKCPITVIAWKYSDNHEAGFDIFLPRFLAKHNKTIFLTLYIVGVIIVAARKLS